MALEIHEKAEGRLVDGVWVVAAKDSGKTAYIARKDGVSYLGLTQKEAVANALAPR